MASFKAIAVRAPRRVEYVQTAAAGTAPDAYVFVNPTGSGEYFEISEVAYVYDVVGGASAAADVKIVPSGTALASGTTALTAAADLTATARIPRKATPATSLSSRTVKPGDSVAIDTSGTLTGLTGLVVQITFNPITVKKVK
jgi:hypothetical protein